MTLEPSPTVDFGRAAQDYARHRPGFPSVFYDLVRSHRVGLSGQRVLDLGTGTGSLARGFAERGCHSVGVDVSPAMLAEATAFSASTQFPVDWVCVPAEATGLPDGAFDVVCAGMCWHWLDRKRTAAEVFRMLRPGGRAVIAYFTYVALGDTVGAATEAVVLRHNPAWPWAGHDGRHPGYIADLVDAGMKHVGTFDQVLPVSFSHAAWRGRIRACNGVLTLPAETVADFDTELAAVLARNYPDPFVAEHRLWGFVTEKPGEDG